MELIIVGLALVLVAAGAAAFVVLVRRMQQEVAEQQARTLEVQVTLMEQLRKSSDTALRESREQTQDFLSAAVETLTASSVRAAETAMKTVDMMATRSQASSRDSQKEMQETIRSITSALATKDTLAYHQVMSPAPVADSDPEVPYPAVDDFGNAELLRQQTQQSIDDSLAWLTNQGVVSDGSTGQPFPYPGAAE